MIEIIPAIDIIGGKCVRLTQGDYAQKTTYYDDPLDAARMYEEWGVRRLHMVDLDGAKKSAPANLDVLRRVSANTSLEIQYGGGIKSRESLTRVLEAGAKHGICGSVAVTDPRKLIEWLEEFGSEAIILGADIKYGRVATHGWLEESELGAQQLIEQFEPYGLSRVICTDISKDGMLQGPTFELYAELQARFPEMDITVSGGISSMEDILKLDRMKLKSVIVGKAIYEGRILPRQIVDYINNK